jgi:hypothetical protein
MGGQGQGCFREGSVEDMLWRAASSFAEGFQLALQLKFLSVRCPEVRPFWRLPRCQVLFQSDSCGNQIPS